MKEKRRNLENPFCLNLKARSFFFFPRAMDEIQTNRKKRRVKLANCWS
jgi:hypothetical protein